MRKSLNVPAGKAHVVNGAARGRKLKQGPVELPIVSHGQYGVMLSRLRALNVELMKYVGGRKINQGDVIALLPRLFREHPVPQDHPGFQALTQQLARDAMEEPLTAEEELRRSLLRGAAGQERILGVFEGESVTAESAVTGNLSALDGLARTLCGQLRLTLQKFSSSGPLSIEPSIARAAGARRKTKKGKSAGERELEDTKAQAPGLLARFNAIRPPPPATIDDNPPANRLERMMWDEAQRQKMKDANAKRTQFGGEIADSMIQTIGSESKLPSLNGKDTPDVYPKLIADAVHGAIEYLCVHFMDSLAPEVLEKAIQDYRQMLKTRQDAIENRQAAKRKKEKKKKKKQPQMEKGPLEERVKENEKIFDRLMLLAEGLPVSIREEPSFPVLLKKVRSEVQIRIRSILCDTSRGHEGVDVMALTKEQFAQTLVAMRRTLTIQASHQLEPRNEVSDTYVARRANGVEGKK